MVMHPAALDLPHAFVEWVTTMIVTREGDRRRKLRPSQRAMVALVYLREHATPAKTVAGFGIGESTAHAYISQVVDLLAERAPGLLKTLREHDPDLGLAGNQHAGLILGLSGSRNLVMSSEVRNRAV
ncbi:transposase family protein, partial [Streptomyces sp. NPDC048489]|uniref:helix-turn-helix domain-containing protein n=1 Tax=Streptomyces sp. NPDC048489 TaxID=3154504 RepID=UPI003417885B